MGFQKADIFCFSESKLFCFCNIKGAERVDQEKMYLPINLWPLKSEHLVHYINPNNNHFCKEEIQTFQKWNSQAKKKKETPPSSSSHQCVIACQDTWRKHTAIIYTNEKKKT